MKVYKSEYIGDFGGGMILIAANNAEAALNIAFREADNQYLFRTWDYTKNDYIVRLSADIMSPFEEMSELSCNLDKPQIIIENLYSE